MEKIIFWLIFCYLFASIPNGYLIVKWMAKKDIRKIDKKKLSGSNIIKNIGFLPGLLSAAIDIFKGSMAVWGAQILNLPSFFIALSGALAVCGQMWPIFLKFWGGRGGATSLGAVLTLSWQICVISASIWLVLKFLSKNYGAPLGMLIFYPLSMFLANIYHNEAIFYFSMISFFLILIQRVLGEPGSIFKIKDKKVFLWRLLFDRDTKENI